MAIGQTQGMTRSLYLFTAADHPLVQASDRLKLREAVTGFGIALRYQERSPDPVGTPEAGWCETGHSIFILAGRISYRFDDHTVEAGPGDLLHIPAGPAHRYKPQVVGTDPVRYVPTEFRHRTNSAGQIRSKPYEAAHIRPATIMAGLPRFA